MMKRILLVAAATVAAILAGFVATGWLLARPVPEHIGAAPPDLGARNVTFPSCSRTNVHAWWCPVTGAKGTVILLPGVRANRLSMVGRARFLRRRGYSVLMPDFQATGETRGDAITFGWRERDDVRAAVRYAREAAPNARVAIIGTSLGGAAALLALPDLHVDALILEAVYPTIERATRNRLAMYLGPAGPLGAPLLLAQLRPRIGASSADLHPVDHIADTGCPLFVIGGARDRRTTPADTMLLYEHARSPKQLWLVPNAAHVDLHAAAPQEYERRVGSFLDAALK